MQRLCMQTYRNSATQYISRLHFGGKYCSSVRKTQADVLLVVVTSDNVCDKHTQRRCFHIPCHDSAIIFPRRFLCYIREPSPSHVVCSRRRCIRRSWMTISRHTKKQTCPPCPISDLQAQSFPFSRILALLFAHFLRRAALPVFPTSSWLTC